MAGSQSPCQGACCCANAACGSSRRQLPSHDAAAQVRATLRCCNTVGAASKSPSVKRVVLTSSCAAIYGDPHEFGKDHVYTEADWCVCVCVRVYVCVCVCVSVRASVGWCIALRAGFPGVLLACTDTAA